MKQSKLWPKGALCVTIAATIAEMTSIKFLEYLLQSFKAVLQAQGKGSAQDNINLATFERQLFPFPPVHRQAAITESLDALATETQRLESIWQQKLAALDELKKSLLHQAFSGALWSKIGLFEHVAGDMSIKAQFLDISATTW